MKFVSPSHFTDPDAAARKLVQIANASEVAQDVAGLTSRPSGHIWRAPRRWPWPASVSPARMRALTLLAEEVVKEEKPPHGQTLA
jgi:hypothetical protein